MEVKRDTEAVDRPPLGVGSETGEVDCLRLKVDSQDWMGLVGLLGRVFGWRVCVGEVFVGDAVDFAADHVGGEAGA